MSEDYFGIERLMSLILLIFPASCWVLGFTTRIKEQKYLAALIRVFLGFHILWIGDILSTIINQCNVKIIRVIDL